MKIYRRATAILYRASVAQRARRHAAFKLLAVKLTISSNVHPESVRQCVYDRKPNPVQAA